jgi:hypothetical protein
MKFSSFRIWFFAFLLPTVLSVPASAAQQAEPEPTGVDSARQVPSVSARQWRRHLPRQAAAGVWRPAGEAVRAYATDVNKDGKPDILVLTTSNWFSTTDTTLWEFLGNGDGSFQAGKQVENHFQPMALADLNGDGRQDIARYDTIWAAGTTSSPGPPRFTNYLGQPDGSFKKVSSYAPCEGLPAEVWPPSQFGDPAALSLVTDLNGDGKPDEVAFQQAAGDSYAQILMGNGDGTFTPTYDIFPFYIYERPAYSHDLDGNGTADMVQLVGASTSLQVLKGGKAPALQLALQDEIVQNRADCGWVFPDVASASDRTVTLTSSAQGVMLPSTVTLPAKALSAKFCYTLAASRDWLKVFDVRAQVSCDTAVAWASQSYIEGFNLSLSTTKTPPLYPGQSSQPITVKLTAAPGYSSKATLHCETTDPQDTCQFTATTLNASPAAPAATTLKLVLGAGAHSLSAPEYITVIADDGHVIKRESIQVQTGWLHLFYSGADIDASSPGTGDATVTIWNYGIPPYTPTCKGLPKGGGCAFFLTQNPYPGASGLNLVVSAPSGLAAGKYPFQIVVTSGNQTASVATNLVITTAAPAPVFTPPAGTYTKPQAVTLSDANTYATMFYTLDGTTPSMFSTQYRWNTPIPINATTTVKAIAWVNNLGMSPVVSATYTINLPPVAKPGFQPAAGTYSSAQSVKLTDATAGATFYYTTDGSAPTTKSTLYAGAIPVKSAETIKSIATAPGYSPSPVAAALYTIQ